MCEWDKVGQRTRAEQRHVTVSSGAIQEYIEAISFMHYLRFSTLISLEEVQADLVDPTTKQQVRHQPRPDEVSAS